MTDVRDTIANRRLVTAILQTIVDSEPDADPDTEDTIVISYTDLETIILTHICGEWAKPWSSSRMREGDDGR